MNQLAADEYVEFAKQLAQQAGAIAAEHFRIGVAAEFKDNNSPVTAADRLINELVIREIKARFPDHDVIGEEASDIRQSSDYVWVCDPIDGTNPFSYGLPYSCFSLALCHKGEPMAAVVLDYGTGRLYWAGKGHGTFRDGERLRVNGQTIEKSVIAASGKSSRYVRASKMHGLLEDTCHRLMLLLCVVQEGLLVANGQIAGGVFAGSTSHDAAAVKLLVDEAGGRTSDLFGKEQRYDKPIRGLVYSNGVIHDDLLAVMARSLR